MAVILENIEAAAARLAGIAVKTPTLQSAALDQAVGAACFIKAETLQRTGSFKFRGAFNRLVQLADAQRAAGVVAWSSGNHAQGVAAAAQLLNMRAVIVMPKDAPAVKLEKTKAYGAEIVLYDRYSEDREAIGKALAHERGAVLVPSYDDVDIIAGQGTVGLEMAAQAGQALDMVYVCCGGGGLSAGIAAAFDALSPSTQVYAVEPAEFDDHGRSLASGRRETNAVGARSICDALLTPSPGALTFPINQALLAGALKVTDDEVKAAMRFAFSDLKLVVEPGGAAALAALLSGALDVRGKRVGVVLTGGNVDPAVFAGIVGGAG